MGTTIRRAVVACHLLDVIAAAAAVDCVGGGGRDGQPLGYPLGAESSRVLRVTIFLLGGGIRSRGGAAT